jgi:uncharacterized SAM-binding protein YcdF (DUF218 family)
MTSPENIVPTSQPHSRRRRISAAAAAVLALLAVGAFFEVGRWLVVEDPLEKAQAIIVLSGRMPIRALEAAKLYRAGYAPQIWLTRSAEPEATMKSLGIPYVGEDFYNFRILVHEGVPLDAIRVLPEPIVNTADEMKAISHALRNEKSHTIIIVTTKAHTRRVRALWRRLGRDKGRAIIRAASADPFEPARWWRTSSDALDVVREVLGLLNAWAGLPLGGS